jgi:hypothetical protein
MIFDYFSIPCSTSLVLLLFMVFILLLFFREMYLHVIYSDLVKENRSLLLILILVGKVALMQCLLDG